MFIYLTTGKVADHLHVTVNTVKRWILEGKLRAIITPGGHYRIREDEFQNFIQKYAPHSNPKKILIIDDNHAQLTLLADTLSSAGKDYIVESASDGYEALIKIGEFKPDLLLLDIMMPKMDGIQVIKKLRGGNTTKNIKVIVITAYPEKLAKIKNNIQDFFTKPVDIDILKKRVIELLGETLTIWGGGG
ncbi:MAG: response regulator [Deltaproteobacteria bacterium]|nr:response regulator [Deltaproteobacteria bacterium]